MNAEISFYDGITIVETVALNSVSSEAEVEIIMRCLQSTALKPFEVKECFTGGRAELKISKSSNESDGVRTFSCGTNPHTVAKVWGE